MICRASLLLLVIAVAPAWAVAEEMIKSGPVKWVEPELARDQPAAAKSQGPWQTVHFEYLKVEDCALPTGETLHTTVRADLEEVVFVKEGKLGVTIKEKSAELGPGSIVLTLPGDERKFTNKGQGPVKFTSLLYRSKKGVNPQRGIDAGGSFFVDYDRLRYTPSERGGGRNFFRRPTAMCEYFEMHTTTLKPNITSHPPHKHVNEEIILNLQGRIEVTVNDVPAILNPGDFTFVVSDEMHGIKNDANAECTYFAFQWK